MKREKAISGKYIVLDEPARKFYENLRKYRKKAGLTQSEAGNYIGVDYVNIGRYERGELCPVLGKFLKLAELYGYDLSRSVNYKYYHKTLSAKKIKREMEKSGITCGEISAATGYGISMVYSSLRMTSEGSVLCLSAALEILKKESCFYRTMIKRYRQDESDIKNVRIVCDEPVKGFIFRLREFRERGGYSRGELESRLKISKGLIRAYETGVCYPTLRNLIYLSEFFEYDISESFNYKVYHGHITSTGIRERVKRSGLTYERLSGMTNYDRRTISHALRGYASRELECLYALDEVLRDIGR